MRDIASFDTRLFIDTQNLERESFRPAVVSSYPEHPSHRARFRSGFAPVAATPQPFLRSYNLGYGAYTPHVEQFSAYAADLRDLETHMRERGEILHNEYQRALRVRQEKLALRRSYIRDNLVDRRPVWRLSRHTWNPSLITTIKRRLKTAGEAVRLALQNEVAVEALIDELNYLRQAVPERRVDDLLDKIKSDSPSFKYDNIRQCSDCGEFVHVEDTGSTDCDETVCTSCLDNNYMYSGCMGSYIPQNRAVAVYDSVHAYHRGSPDDWCTHSYGRDNYYRLDGVYISDEDEYCELTSDDEDEDSPPNDGLREYHNSSRNFVERNAAPALPALGVELEVYADDRRAAVQALKDAFDVPGDLLLERDGSLDSYHGFEIVTQPLGPNEWKDFGPRLLSKLRDNDCSGYNWPAGRGYGIHVNIHRRHFSPLAEARIMMFLCDVVNADFVRAVAQRGSIYHPDIDVGSLYQPKVRRINGGSEHFNQVVGLRGYTRKIWGAGKYCPVNWQYNIAEFRLFQSTLNETSFMKNLEFVWALTAWTKPEAATGSSHYYVDFVRWLDSPQRRRDYPNLVKYLSKKVFFVTDDTDRKIHNTWSHLLTKPSEEEAREPEAA